MPFIGFLVKAYIAVLIFRVIFTQQELSFNNVGRAVAKITNPLFKAKHKSEADKLVPVYIALIGLLYGVLIGLFKGKAAGSFLYGIIASIGIAYSEIFTFLAMFFVVCLLLGALASPGTGAFPVFFYRIGNMWVKPVRKVLPLKGNGIVVPTIIFIFVVFAALTIAVNLLVSLTTPASFNLYAVSVASGLSFLYTLTGLLRIFMIVLIIRAVMSWFSPDPRNALVQLVYYATEPVLAPLRKIIPPISGLDLSALVAMLIVAVLQNFLASALASLARILLS